MSMSKRVVALFSFALLVWMDFTQGDRNPYLGIFTYIVAPAFLFLGLALLAFLFALAALGLRLLDRALHGLARLGLLERASRQHGVARPNHRLVARHPQQAVARREPDGDHQRVARERAVPADGRDPDEVMRDELMRTLSSVAPRNCPGEPTVVVLEGADQLHRWQKALAEVPSIKAVVVLDPAIAGEDERTITWDDLLARPPVAPPPPQ